MRSNRHPGERPAPGGHRQPSAWDGVTRALFPCAAAALLTASLVAWLGARAGLLAWALPIAGTALALGFAQCRARRRDLVRFSGLEAELSIYRVGETMAAARSESDLARSALDALAEETGIRHWALFTRTAPGETLQLLATREIPEDAAAEFAKDTAGADAPSAAGRAAWKGETLIAGGPDPGPELSFAARNDTLGAGSTAVCVPLPDHGEGGGVLECLLPPGVEIEAGQLALLRWMAAQIANGLRQLRLERRARMLASYSLSTGEILLGLDASGEITHANPAAEEALRAPQRGLRGVSLDRLAVVDGAEEIPSIVDLFRSVGEYSGAIWFRRSDGTRFPAAVRVSPIPDQDGSPRAMVLVGHDDSQRRERERELESRSQEAAHANRRLEAANRDLTHAQRLQNEFLANTSHELRTPLNAVIGFATLLEQGASSGEEETQEFARSIRESAAHLLTVINDLLDLAKIEAGRLQLRLEPGDLREAVRAAAEAVAPAAAKKGLRIDLRLPEEPLRAAIDPARLRQIMLNLLGNAVKFTDRGEVRIRALRDPGTEGSHIVVEDTGVGIAKDRQGRLFTKFGQVDTSYHRRHAGAGLGLAITRALVESMGGTVAVESEGVNQGATATVVFPPLIDAAVAAGRD
jgi:PAS domain S-box-containing protein